MGKGGQNNVAAGSLQAKKISLDELAKHRTIEDAWIAYRGKVYDVSNWEDHPGNILLNSKVLDVTVCLTQAAL